MLLKQKRILILIVAILSIIAITVACLYFIPIGKGVHVIAATTPGTVSINGCSLREIYMLNFNNPEPSDSLGDRVIVLRVFNNQTELFTIQKTNISNYLGNYIIDTPTLPADVTVNSELHITIQLIDSTGNLLAEDETTILYK